ncbi:MAG: GNAT family N-acetyltransferase, partial [Proteobacteria bacterium]|nr:GNAT family N-acetyltransferase [Pseudomonadota bacterium]
MDLNHQPKSKFEVRRYRDGEATLLNEIYVESTRRLNSRDYTPAQIERWVAKHADLPEWSTRLFTTQPWVAVLNDRPVAFAELEPNGHIDFFYCHPDFQGQGAGSALMSTLVAEARRIGLAELWAEVSVTAE